MFDTIVALATAPIKSALALIRVSGPKSAEILEKVFQTKYELKPNYVRYGKIIDPRTNEIIDEVMATFFKSPHSFTGEDMVEITSHGSMLIVHQIVETMLFLGARYASRGEYTSRAFYNGKMDLIQAEAVNDLINAESLASKNISMNALNGKTSALLTPLVDNLAGLLANIEVNIDYPEYKDIEEITYESIVETMKASKKTMDSLINDGKKNLAVVEGFSVALIGAPNAGKSSLLNALINQDKAIVTEIPGTTRDVVEAEMNLEGITLHLYDTAGIRKTDNVIEKIGIEKSIENIKNADLVLYIKDAITEEIDEEVEKLLDGKNVIVVYNKSDLLKQKNNNRIEISALNNDIEKVKQAIKKALNLDQVEYTKPSLCSARQIALLEKARDEMESALEQVVSLLPLDLVAIHLKSAYDYINEVLGKEIRVDLEREIFARFCVGK